MADPTYQGSGTVYEAGGASSTSLSTTITDVAVGDLLVVQVRREEQNDCTGVASTSPALTFARQARAGGHGSELYQDIWTAIATSAASSMVITASYSASGVSRYGAIISHRYSSGITSATATHSASHNSLQSASTNRATPNITTTARTLLIAAGDDQDYYNTHTAASGWTKRLDSDTKGNDTTAMWMYDRIADAGTYPNGNVGTVNNSDQYFGSTIALPVDASGSATGLPRRALDGPFYGALRGSVR
jgi:hypothetical protein